MYPNNVSLELAPLPIVKCPVLGIECDKDHVGEAADGEGAKCPVYGCLCYHLKGEE